MQPTDAVVVAAVRTPVGRGKQGGALAGVHPVDLLAGVLDALVRQVGIDAKHVDDVIVGCVQQVGDQSGNIARTAALAAGLPESVPALTLNRQCGSSQQAVAFAAQGVQSGAYDVVIAAGVESMSWIPLGSSRPDTSGEMLPQRYPEGLVGQGVAAELVADRWNLGRAELDEFSARSHRRAARAWATGAFEAEVVAVPQAPGLLCDETVRPGTTTDSLAGLRPSFRTDELAARFPHLDWRITAGSSSPVSDGASAVLVMSAARAAELGVVPRARFRGFSVIGDDPLQMLTGPIPATRAVLERSGVALGDIDAFEVNEAFACVPLAWARELGADLDKVNLRGGAIALGHALGSSGTRLLVTLLHLLESTGGSLGLQTMCEAGGMANALVLERL